MSSTADSIIIKRWFNKRTLPYSDDSEKFLRGLGVTSVEDLKLLSREQFSELFKGESFIVKQTADLVFQELGKCSTAASLVQAGRAKPKATISPDAAKLPVLIVGAGVGGLSSAIALSDIGLQSIVLDQRSDNQLLDGAGINLQAEAIEALNSLGVSTETLLREGNVITKQSYYLPDGRHVCSIDKNASSEGSIPKQVAIHRGKLIELLLTVASRRDSIQLRTNHCVREVHQESSCSKQGSIDIIADSTMSSHPVSTTPVALSGSMVLGADGINSNIRKNYIFSEEKDPLCFQGVTHYRGVVDAYPTLLDGHTMVVIGGLNIKVVVYPITEPKDGLQRLNWIVAVKEEEANTDKSAHQQFLVRLLSNHGFNPDFVDLKSMITNTSSIQAWPMVDLKPLPCWINGRIALVGDSAHAMLPVGSSGSLAALLDSLALREAFQKSGMVTVNDVLSLYEQMRYKSASLHQQKCKLQPAEFEAQSAMDTFTAGEVIPQEYAERIQVAMKKLHNPSRFMKATYCDVNVKNQVIIIGGGASGLTACKEFAEKGLVPTVYESAKTFGGVFRDAYQKLELTSSSAFTAFSDYPPADDEVTMWSTSEYLSYLHKYAVHNGLFKCINFNSTITGIRRVHNHECCSQRETLWEVVVHNSVTNSTRTVLAGHLVLCVGSNATPNIPTFSGQQQFCGKVMHSSHLDGFDMFKGKRVLCLGIGESGSDIPYHIAKQEGATVTVAVRGLGWMVPRRRPLKTGSPTDLNTNRLLWGLPRIFNRAVSFLLAIFDSLDSDPVIRRMGSMNLRHPAGVYKTYGTKSINFLAAIEHLGATLVESTIQSMGPGNRVTFSNGSTADYDIVLLNTGYKKSNFHGFSASDDDEVLFNILSEASYVRNLFKRVLHPALKNLYFIGFARPGFSSIPCIAEMHARLAACLASGSVEFPSEDEMIQEIAADKFRDETQFGGAARRVGTLVDYLPHVNDIASILDATPPYMKLLVTDPGLLFKIFFGPATVAQLRLTGVDAKPGVAKSTIKSYPPIPMRRLTYIATGLYLSSLIVMLCSLAVPITLHARKSLLPVGFPSINGRPMKIVRYMLFWIHTLGLSYFYSAKTGFHQAAIVVLISCMEINGYLAQKARVEALQDLLTSEAEASTFKPSINKKPCKTRRPTRSSTMIVARCMPIIFGVLALFLQMAQKGLIASAFKTQHPSNKRVVFKNQHNEATPMMLTTKAGGNLLDELSEVYHFSPIERVALTCSGSLQQMLSSYHLQSCQVEVSSANYSFKQHAHPMYK